MPYQRHHLNIQNIYKKIINGFFNTSPVTSPLPSPANVQIASIARLVLHWNIHPHVIFFFWFRTEYSLQPNVLHGILRWKCKITWRERRKWKTCTFFWKFYNEMIRIQDCHFNFKGCHICIGSELQVYRFAYLTICFGQSGDMHY